MPRLTGFREKAQIKADVASARTIIGAAQVAVADGATVAGGDTLAATGLGNYLNSWPTAQYTGTLTLVLTGTEFSVTNGTVEIAPNPATAYDIP